MQLIKKASIFKAVIPPFEISDIEAKIEAESLKAEKPLPSMIERAGFAGVRDSADFICCLADGFAMRVVIWRKKLNNKAIKASADAIIKAREVSGEKIGKKERQDIIEAVKAEVITQTLPEPVVVTCYYKSTYKHLIIDSTSKSDCNIVMGLIGKLFDEMEFEAIHIDESLYNCEVKTAVKEDLMLTDSLQVCGKIKLKRGKDKFALDVASLDEAEGSISEWIDGGASVSEIQVTDVDTNLSFVIDDSFKLKAITCPDYADEDDGFCSAAMIETANISKAVDSIIKRFGVDSGEK